MKSEIRVVQVTTTTRRVTFSLRDLAAVLAQAKILPNLVGADYCLESRALETPVDDLDETFSITQIWKRAENSPVSEIATDGLSLPTIQ